MLPDSIPPAPEPTFAVEFNSYVAGNWNRDLGGKGRLVVRAEEPRFVFTGHSRGLFSIAKSTTDIALRSDEIWNVVVHERGVEFSTPAGKCGAKKTPFVFTCASEDEALAVAALLPATKDEGFLQDQSFIRQVRALPDGRSGLGSITNLLVAANTIAFILMGLAGAGWFEVASMEPYMRHGANNAAATTDGEWWRLVSAMFIHYGLMHLLLNVWALSQAGDLVERLFGRTLFALIYFASGIMGGLATLLWNGDKVWSAGASGAVFGVYGALLGYLGREKHGVPPGIFKPMLKSTLLFAGYNLVFGAVHPNIDNAAHLGGLLGGVLLGWICALPIERGARERVRSRRGITGLLVAGIVITVGVVAAPRYDYRVSEELALNRMNRPNATQQQAILKEEQAELNAWRQSGDGTRLIRWLAERGIPFYEKWRRDLDTLSLSPGRATSRRRESLRLPLQAKIDAYRGLSDDVRDNHPAALAHYEEALKKMAAASGTAKSQP